MRIALDTEFRIFDWKQMNMTDMHRQSEIPWHQPVLLNEVIDLLAPEPGETMVDCTVGLGGHSLAILPRLMPLGRLIAIDCDAQALALARKRLTEFLPQVQLIHDNFRSLFEILKRIGAPGVHGLIADLGLCSFHLESSERGFSFLREGPLDMRMDGRTRETAAAIVQRMSERDLTELMQRYGQERWARRIAKRIVSARNKAPIQTTTQLARLVAEAIPRHAHPRSINPATRTFLALRIAVNGELASLEAMLDALPDVLMPGGRALVITFHSLEDRIVKQAFQRGAKAGVFRLLVKKPVRPSACEIAKNPRARSAKLRAVERLP